MDRFNRDSVNKTIICNWENPNIRYQQPLTERLIEQAIREGLIIQKHPEFVSADESERLVFTVQNIRISGEFEQGELKQMITRISVTATFHSYEQKEKFMQMKTEKIKAG